MAPGQHVSTGAGNAEPPALAAPGERSLGLRKPTRDYALELLRFFTYFFCD